MLDLKFVIENIDEVKEALKKRFNDLDVDNIISLDKERKDFILKVEEMKAKRNTMSAQIPQMMKENKDISPIKEEVRQLGEEIKVIDEKLKAVETIIKDLLLNIPNIPVHGVPVGKDDSENEEIRKFKDITTFDFEPKAHWDLGKDLDIIDVENAVKISGTRFTIYKGLGARLERAIINFFMDTHAQNGYTEILPPYIVTRKSMTGTGQLPKFEDDAFKLTNDTFLIPTAEVPVTNMLSGETLMKEDLPQRYCAYSACFRAEAGSAGRDTRGLIRQHQFNKVELVHFTDRENYEQELERLLNEAELLLQKLELPYRVVKLCTGDLGFSSAITYDIEVYMPSYGRYVEISSCSCFTDYQARRMNLKYKEDKKSKPQFLYTFNGSGLAVGRTVAAVLENYQQADGSIKIPKELVKYMYTEEIK